MNTTNALLTDEGAKCLQEIDDFMLSTVTDFNIENEEQARSARLLGNELQKGITRLREQSKRETYLRRAEIAVIRKDIADIETPFEERELKLNNCKQILADGLTAWKRQCEDTQRREQLVANKETQDERERWEALAQSDPENAEMYLEAAAKCVAPYIKKESKEAMRGTRSVDELHIDIRDRKLFMQWCATCGAEHFWDLNTKNLVARAKEDGGTFEAPGITVTIQKKVTFTGR
jgi:hypothetical protein